MSEETLGMLETYIRDSGKLQAVRNVYGWLGERIGGVEYGYQREETMRDALDVIAHIIGVPAPRFPGKGAGDE